MAQGQKYLTVSLCPKSLLCFCSFKDSISGKQLHIVLRISLQISNRQNGYSRVSNINTLYLSATLSITIRYAVIGHLPSSTGAVHFTVSEVAWISVAENMMAGGPGLSRRNLICIIYLYFYSNRVYYTDVLNLTLERYKDTYLFVPESLKSRLKDQDHGR